MAFLILIRILFAVSMVFIIGYIFGGFSKKPSLTVFSKIAAILVIVLFIGSNVLLMRFAFAKGGGRGPWCNREAAHERGDFHRDSVAYPGR